MSIYYSEREGEKEISISFDKSEDFFKYLEWLDREVEEKEIVIAPLEIEQDSEEESGWISWVSWRPATDDFGRVPESLHPEDCVKVKFRNGTEEADWVKFFNWRQPGSDWDIVAYKVIKNYKEEQEV